MISTAGLGKKCRIFFQKAARLFSEIGKASRRKRQHAENTNARPGMGRALGFSKKGR
jgi:hypothetical protein